MDAETRAALAELAARLDAVEARLERGRSEFRRIHYVIEGYADRQDKHNATLWQARRDADLKRERLFAEMDAVIAEVALLRTAVAELQKRVDDAQQSRRTRKSTRRRTYPDD